MKKTVIIGSVPKPYRYAFQAAEMLEERALDFVPVGIQEGKVLGKEILNIYQEPEIENVHTLTLYINSKRQVTCEDYLLSLNPERIIFNPGAENQDFKTRAEAKGIECLDACTLVMLSVGNF